MMEGYLMERGQAMEELTARLKNKNLVKHCIAVEAIMRELAGHFGYDPEVWGLAGLLHDIDYDMTKDDPAKHSLLAAEILEGLGVDNEIIYAVKAHNGYHGIERKRKIDKALYCADPVSGLITAAALILPSKKLSDVDENFVLRRMDEKAFARGADREQIRSCSELGLTLEEFIAIALSAMKKVAEDLGL